MSLLCERIGFPEPEFPWQLCDILLRQEDIDKGVLCTEMGAKSILHKVEYMADEDRLMPSVVQERMPNVFEQMKAGTLGTPNCHCDLLLSDETISKMEIISSPEMSAGNRVLLDVLVRKYCPDADMLATQPRRMKHLQVSIVCRCLCRDKCSGVHCCGSHL